MASYRIFVSSVQREFTRERLALRDFLRSNALLGRLFDLFLDVPASDRRADDLYLEEVERCDIYVGLFGEEYGSEDAEGVSPTEREFDQATVCGSHRLIFVKGAVAGHRHPKMGALIDKAQSGLIRKRFDTTEELIAALYAALVGYLDVVKRIRWGPFDASICEEASLDDLDSERMARFVAVARAARRFPLPETIAPSHLLEHLNLLSEGRPTNAAALLFGKSPQRFLLSSEIKCLRFHGTKVEKPIASLQVYQGTVFELVDQAVDFVLAKIDRSVGTRARSVQAPVTYEIPIEVVTEAIVNAVAHRDYTSNGSVQVMLFSDRLEVWNPGRLPPQLTLAKLRLPHGSVPSNRLIAKALYLAKYIERAGTGTLDMIDRCVAAGLPEPEFTVTDGFAVTIPRAEPQSRPEPSKKPSDQQTAELADKEVAMLRACSRTGATAAELRAAAGYARRTSAFRQRLEYLLENGLVRMTLADKPSSSLQRYRITSKGAALLERSEAQVGSPSGVQVESKWSPSCKPSLARSQCANRFGREGHSALGGLRYGRCHECRTAEGLRICEPDGNVQAAAGPSSAELAAGVDSTRTAAQQVATLPTDSQGQGRVGSIG